MSGKDTSSPFSHFSFSRRRTRRQTTDYLKNILESEKDDSIRFSYFFRKFCDENSLNFLAGVNVYVVKEDGQATQMDQGAITLKDCPEDQTFKPIVNAYCDANLLLRKVLCKSPNMDTRIILALGKAILYFANLFTLILDYCDLTADQISLLTNDLKVKQNIKELSLKGNPNSEQNFYLLVGCGLKVLKLKLCGIDENGLKKIAEEFLNCSPYSTLIHLDLSSNMIFDEGCKYVASILRCDRTLQSLNLSDCKIGDEGFEEIIKSFQKFSLCDEEIFVRRKTRLEYFKSLQKVEKDAVFVEKPSYLQVGEQQHITINKEALSIAEAKLKKHPFTAECYLENEDIFCNGNYSLASLNISYNHLTKPSFELILKILMEQSSVFGLEKGLNRLILDGPPDDASKYETVRNAIGDLLISRKTRKSLSGSGKLRMSLKRRKSSAASAASILSMENNKTRESLLQNIDSK